MFIGVCVPQESIPETRNRCSDTLLPEPAQWLSHEFWHPDQVVRGATEDEQPVHFLQTSQLDLAQRAGLLEPAEALLDQPSPTQANGMARQTRGSAVQVAADLPGTPLNLSRDFTRRRMLCSRRNFNRARSGVTAGDMETPMDGGWRE